MKLLRPKYTTAMVFAFFFLCIFKVEAQTNLEGNYSDSGYFFHPSVPRSIASWKAITQVN